jgi:uncharacterized membrane protein
MKKFFKLYVKKIISRELLLFAALAIGIAIRFLLLLRPEQYWFDEILSVYISRYNVSITNLIRFLQIGEYHPPLYYIIMFYWTRIFGITEIATRSFSLLFGVLTLPLYYIFVGKLFRKKYISELALFLLSINALHIEYSIEARPYTFFTFVGLLAAYFFVLLIKNRRKFYWFCFILLNVTGLYIHYSYSFILASFVAFQVYTLFSKKIENRYKFTPKEVATTVGLITLGFFPWLPTFIKRFIESVNGLAVYGVENDLGFIRFSATHIEHLLFSYFWLAKMGQNKLGLILVGLGKLALFVFLYPLFISSWKEKKSWKFGFLALVFAVPLLMYMFTSYFASYSRIISRHVIFSVFPLCLLTSFSLLSFKITKKKLLLLLLFIISLLVPLSNVVISASGYDQDFRVEHIASYIEANEEDGDMVLLNHHVFPVIFNHYYKGKSRVGSFFPIDSESNNILLSSGELDSTKTKFMTHSYFLNGDNYQSLTKTVSGNERVWLICILNNPYFTRYFVESGWILKEIVPLDYTFPVLLFDKK